MSTGALAGLAARSMGGAATAGLVSHAVLDALPHDDVLSARAEGCVADVGAESKCTAPHVPEDLGERP